MQKQHPCRLIHLMLLQSTGLGIARESTLLLDLQQGVQEIPDASLESLASVALSIGLDHQH